MLTIGEIAGITGVSVKALRHYDEKRVLPPAEVDDRTGYRRYGEGQVRAVVVVKALRDAGVPLVDVAAAVRGGDAAAVLAARRDHVLAERAAEDRAHAEALAVLAALAVPVSIERREAPPQHYLGRVIAMTTAEADALTDDRADAEFGALFLRMREAGIAPAGAFWSAIRAGGADAVEVVGCWPIDAEPPSGLADATTVVGVLPRRTELVATWRPDGDESLPDGAAHPAIVALFDALADLDDPVTWSEVRQMPLDDAAVEVAITLRAH